MSENKKCYYKINVLLPVRGNTTFVFKKRNFALYSHGWNIERDFQLIFGIPFMEKQPLQRHLITKVFEKDKKEITIYYQFYFSSIDNDGFDKLLKNKHLKQKSLDKAINQIIKNDNNLIMRRMLKAANERFAIEELKSLGRKVQGFFYRTFHIESIVKKYKSFKKKPYKNHKDKKNK